MFYETWMSSDPVAASRAVRKITDKNLLRQLAQFGRLSEVRTEALFQLNEPELWEKAAKEDQDASVRRSAVRHITDLNVLQEILLQDSDSTVLETAAIRRDQLIDQNSEIE